MSSIFLTLFFFLYKMKLWFSELFHHLLCSTILNFDPIHQSEVYCVPEYVYQYSIRAPILLFLCPSPPSCLRLKPSCVFLKGCLSLCLSDGSSSQTAAGAIRELLSRGNGPPSPPTGSLEDLHGLRLHSC